MNRNFNIATKGARKNILLKTIEKKEVITLCMQNLNIRRHRDITGEMWFGVG